MTRMSGRLWRFPLWEAETATNGAKLPPVAPIGAGSWRQSALGGGANRRWAVAPALAEKAEKAEHVGRCRIQSKFYSMFS